METTKILTLAGIVSAVFAVAFKESEVAAYILVFVCVVLFAAALFASRREQWRRRQILIHIDKDPVQDSQLGWVWQGRVRNGTEESLQNVSISIVHFSGRSEDPTGINLQWFGPSCKVPIEPNRGDIRFVLICAKESTVRFVGYTHNCGSWSVAVGDGELDLTLQIFGDGISDVIERRVKLRVTKKPNRNAVQVL